MRRRETRRKGDQQGSKKSITARLEKWEKKTRLRRKIYCPQKRSMRAHCHLFEGGGRLSNRSETTLTVQRREEDDKKPKKRTEAVRVIMVYQALETE